MASDALKEAASCIGKAVVWLLEEFAGVFAKASTIDLDDTGIGNVIALMTTLSAVIAVFLLLIQFGKVGLSQSGAPAATALTGLAKWAVISSGLQAMNSSVSSGVPSASIRWAAPWAGSRSSSRIPRP